MLSFAPLSSSLHPFPYCCSTKNAHMCILLLFFRSSLMSTIRASRSLYPCPPWLQYLHLCYLTTFLKLPRCLSHCSEQLLTCQVQCWSTCIWNDEQCCSSLCWSNRLLGIAKKWLPYGKYQMREHRWHLWTTEVTEHLNTWMWSATSLQWTVLLLVLDQLRTNDQQGKAKGLLCSLGHHWHVPVLLYFSLVSCSTQTAIQLSCRLLWLNVLPSTSVNERFFFLVKRAAVLCIFLGLVPTL